MRTINLRALLLVVLWSVILTIVAQTPQWDANGLGRSFLAPNAGNMNPIYNATIGTSASDFGTLRVRGDQLLVLDPMFFGNEQ